MRLIPFPKPSVIFCGRLRFFRNKKSNYLALVLAEWYVQVAFSGKHIANKISIQKVLQTKRSAGTRAKLAQKKGKNKHNAHFCLLFIFAFLLHSESNRDRSALFIKAI
jgi:hypothetical protein